ncbi:MULTISPECIES: septal ring lytic transglycosylase RlpA family protein [unclassified Nitrospina]|uniref:septal ring lytic transglycosylase RlpA family protein n=1 Tax=unclassified Nitrospina TaxID=2638683 RepID=UPI003F9B4010
MESRQPLSFTFKYLLTLWILAGASACTHDLTPAMGHGHGALSPALERMDNLNAKHMPTEPISHETSTVDETMPYDVEGKVYEPLDRADGFSEEGVASWYGHPFHGQETSNKEVYNMNALTAAHKTLPFHSRVRVTNLENGKVVTVRINDRGPFVGDRVIDLSFKAAQLLGMADQGTARVRVTVLESGTARKPEVTLASGPGTVFYSIQLGLFENRNSAEQLSRQYDGEVRPVDRDGQTWYQVIAGHAPDYENAILLREKLRGQGREDAFIIRNWRPSSAALNN